MDKDSSTSRGWRALSAYRKLTTVIEERAEILRLALLVCFIRPAAHVPWRAFGEACAFLCGVTATVFTWLGRESVREFRAAFNVRFARALALAVRWNSARYREFLSQQRIILGFDTQRSVVLHHANYEPVREHLAQGGSLVLALAHFCRDDILHASINNETLPLPIKFLVGGPPRAGGPDSWRAAAQYSQIQRALLAYRPEGLELVQLGRNVAVPASAVRHLRTGGIVALMVDTTWSPQKGPALIRPFAGFQSQAFAVGAGALARVGRCPVVLCLPRRLPNGSILLQWSELIAAPAADDARAQLAVTDRLLDLIEAEVGRNPSEYIFPCGAERRWDFATQAWANRPPAGGVPGAAGIAETSSAQPRSIGRPLGLRE